MEWSERSETRSRGSMLTTKARMELLENQQRKEQGCSGLVENISRPRGENTATNGNDRLDRY